MKPKSVFNLILVVAVVQFLTGCICTHAILEKSNERSVDTLNASAVYRQTTNHVFALEGTRTNHDKTSVHAFLMIPQYLLAYAQLQTNKNLSLEEIRKLEIKKSENFPARNLESKSRLSSDFEKIAELPRNDVNIEVKEHHPKAFLFILLPGAFAADVVTLPFQCFYAFTHWGC